MPSAHSEPIANASAVAQSIPSPASIAARFASSCRAILGLRRKPSGTVTRPRPISRNCLAGNAGIAAAVVVRSLFEPGPRALEPVGLVRAIALGRLELSFELREKPGRHRVGLAVTQHARLDETLGIELPRRRMARDRAVHQRLGEGRLVGLVMAVPAIAEQVDDDVLLEFAGGIRQRRGRLRRPLRDRRH